MIRQRVGRFSLVAKSIATSVVVAFLVTSMSCSSSSDDKASSPTTSGVGSDTAGDLEAGNGTDGSSSEWSTDTTIPKGDAVYLLATWEIEIGDLVASGPADGSGIPDGVICEGKVRLSIRVDGTFTQSGKPKCEQDKQMRSAEIKSTGRWRMAGNRLELSEVEDKGQIYLFKGVEPFTPGLKDGVVTYSIDADTLTLSVETGDGEVAIQRWGYADPM